MIISTYKAWALHGEDGTYQPPSECYAVPGMIAQLWRSKTAAKKCAREGEVPVEVKVTVELEAKRD